MITGISPVEAAYSYAGYVVQGEIMSFLTKGYIFLAVFLFGMVWMIYRSLLAKNIKPFLVYFILVTFLWILFGRTSKSISNPESLAKSEGAEVSISISEVLSVSSKGLVSPGFLFVSQGMDTIVHGMIKALDNTTLLKEGFLTSPFAGLRFQNALLNMVVDDPETKSEFRDWFRKCYGPAVMQYGEELDEGLTEAVDTSWPENLKSYLSAHKNSSGTDGWTEWSNLKEKIYTHAEGRYKEDVPIWKRMFRNRDKDTIIKYMTKKQLKKEVFLSSLGKYTSGKAGWKTGLKQVLGGGLNVLSGSLLSTCAAAVINALPMIQGILVFLAYSLFPIILLISFFPSGQGTLLVYFLSLLAIKSFNFLWALISTFGTALNTSAGTGDSVFMTNTVVPIVTLSMVLLTPVASFMLIRGSMQAFAGAGATVGGGAEKAAGVGTAAAMKQT